MRGFLKYISHFTLHSSRSSLGSASIEMAAALPMLALCMLVMVQVFGVFVDASQRLQAADARVAEAMRNHMSLGSEHGFEWPCLERIAVGSEGSVTIDGDPKAVGLGLWRRSIETPQEVTFVTGQICND